MNWEIISTYTRQDAIIDGVLIDITSATAEGETIPLCRQAGFITPVAMTAAAFAQTVELGGKWESDGENHEILKLPGGQDCTGRIWDVLNLIRYAVKMSRGPVDRINFSVDVHNGRRLERKDLWAHIGPGDNGEPVITIMMQGED
jgi:hypothetical protein